MFWGRGSTWCNIWSKFWSIDVNWRLWSLDFWVKKTDIRINFFFYFFPVFVISTAHLCWARWRHQFNNLLAHLSHPMTSLLNNFLCIQMNFVQLLCILWCSFIQLVKNRLSLFELLSKFGRCCLEIFIMSFVFSYVQFNAWRWRFDIFVVPIHDVHHACVYLWIACRRSLKKWMFLRTQYLLFQNCFCHSCITLWSVSCFLW